MKAIDILMDEHVVILEHLQNLRLAAARIVKNEGPPKAFFEEGMSICREFADRYHHYKEEHVMFGLLAQKHDGKIDGEIDRHRNQHEQCRDLIQTISESLDGYAQNLNESSRRVHRSLSDYVDILTSHIRSENQIFFPMAAEALNEEDAAYLLDAFEKYEGKATEGSLDDFRARVQRLGAQLE